MQTPFIRGPPLNPPPPTPGWGRGRFGPNLLRWRPSLSLLRAIEHLEPLLWLRL